MACRGRRGDIFMRWIPFTKENVRRVLDVYGAYELANANKEVIYIGCGKLRSRLLTHFKDIVGVAYFRYEKTGSQERAKQRERMLLRKYLSTHGGKLPKFNERRR